MNGNARTGILSDILGSLLGVSDDIALAVVFNEPALLLGVLPGSSKFNLDFDAKALPIANQTANIYKGKVSFTKKLLWIANITVNLTNRSYDNPVNLSYDKYAGGRYELFGQIADINLFDDNGDLTQFQADLLNLLGSVNINFNVENTFGFIPTASALDVGQGYVILNDTDYSRVYTAANPPTGNRVIPFQNFITAFENSNSINERHISFNTRNGNWLATELDNSATNNQVFDCTFICSGTSGSQISGNETLCTSGVFSVASGASTYSWSIIEGGNLVSLSDTGLSSVTLTSSNAGSGFVTLLVTYGNTICGEISLTKRVWVGAPQFNAFTFGNDGAIESCISPNYCLTTSLQSLVIFADFNGMSASEIQNNSNWEWEPNNNLILLNSVESRTQVCPIATGTSNFRVRAKNACGWSDWIDYQFFDISECPFNFRTSATIYTVYPNPSKDIVNIELTDEKNMPNNKSEITGELFDIKGQSRRKVQIKNNTASIPVSGLAKGIYVLNINVDGKVEGHQIIVE